MKKMVWVILAPVFAMILTACTLETPGTGPRPPSAVTLPVSGLSVAGPSGFCVDTGSVRDGQNGGFVLLGSCTGLSGGNNPGLKGKTAVLTLSISAPLSQGESFDAPSVEAFFASEAGRKALSRRGSARTVTLIESDVEGGRLWLHARDSAPNMLAGQGDEYWRALFVLKGRLVTVTATPFDEAPMSEAGLRKLLERFVSDLERRNPGML